MSLDPVTYEVVSNRLWQITQEGREALIGVAASPIVVETRDCFGCVYLPDGTPVEGMASDQCVTSVIRLCQDDPGIADGDMFLINDPWLGPKHSPDVTIVAPVHFDGELVGWVGSMTHHLDIGAVAAGGRTPGATDIYQEGLRIPPIKLIEGGKLRSDLFRFILNMIRSPEKCALDYKAQIAANNVQRAALEDLCRRYSGPVVREVMEELVARTERRFRARLRELPDGAYSQELYIDTDGVGEKLLTWALTMTKTDDELLFDFTGTSEQVAGPINTPPVATRHSISGSLNRILCAGADYIDANAGVLRPVRIISPEGTLVNPRPPAPCSAALSTVIGALTQACIAKMLAASEKYHEDAMAVWPSAGGSIKVNLSGTNQYGRHYTYTFMDNIGMGCAASAMKDGVDSGGDHTDEPAISNIETHEAANPILFLFRREVPDSGGPGMFRGGVGMEAMFVPYGADRLGLTLLSYGMEMPIAVGLEGGLPGACVAAAMVRDSNARALLASGAVPLSLDALSGQREALPQVLKQASINANDAFYFRWMGGAGYGDPRDRDPALVERDVREGRVTPEAAARFYTPRDGASDWRTRRHSPPAGRRLGEYLEAVDGDARCRKCGHAYAPVSLDMPLSELGYVTHTWLPDAPLKESGKARLRQLSCPGCGTVFSSEVVLHAT